jgi:hypothetical protein
MDSGQTQAYYRAALTALHYVEHRAPTGRRFGQDADLLWASFRGHLQDVDRIDLLLRDADAQWPGSLGARRVFDLHGVAEDDAFGKDWAPLDPVTGAELWRETLAEPAPENLGAALSRIAAVWGLALSPFSHDPVAPSSRLVLAGPSAVAALAHAFEGQSDLDWADQVAIVASNPGTRQLAAFCGAALNVTKPTVLLAAEQRPEASLAGRTPLVSEDAPAADAAWARAVVGG